MKSAIFEFISYKEYLQCRIEMRPHKGRGERSRIARALQCQLAYVSQVLNGEAHFSFEQAEALNSLLSHTEEEAEFFLLLVHLDRAGSAALKKRIKNKIQKVLNQRLILRNRLEFEKTLSRENQTHYYSAWYYAAIHIALAIPALQTRDALARAFSLPISRVSKVLDFLLTCGLAEETNGRFRIGDVRIHLESDSSMISKHHINWRMQAVQSLEKDGANELHYSSVVSMGEKDILKLREVLVNAIENIREIVKPSPDETLYCYTMDFFSLIS